METRRRTRLMSIVVVALVFVAGFAAGVAFDRIAIADPGGVTAASGDEEEDGRPGRRPLYERVGELTADQEGRIDSIVQEHRGRMDTLQKEFRASYNPRYYEIVENTRRAIRGVMTDEQAERYDSLVGEWEEKRDERRKDGGGDDSGPGRSRGGK